MRIERGSSGTLVGMRTLRLLALACAVVAVAAACDEGDDPPEVSVVPLTSTPTATLEPTPTPTPEIAIEFDPVLHAVVGKENPVPAIADPAQDDLVFLPADWLAPGYVDLQARDVAFEALGEMRAAAAADGVNLLVRSAYRSYEEQEATFAYWVGLLGEEQAERESARPGLSEHQLGTAIDFASPENGYELIESFGDSAEGRWLAEHAVEYGFAMSYPPDGEDVTGYIYEPWHFRYIGVEAAQAWQESGEYLIVFLRQLAER